MNEKKPMNNSQIDEAILSVVAERWTKVARVIPEVAKAMGGDLRSQGENFEAIAQRIEALVSDGRLSAQGNIKRWRFSEVRRAMLEPRRI